MTDFEERLRLIGERSGDWMPKLGPDSERQGGALISIDDYLSYFSFQGLTYPFLMRATLGQHEEWPDPAFESYVQALFRNNGVVFACILRRLLVFTDIRFQWQRTADSVGPASGDVTSALRAAGVSEQIVDVVSGSLRGRPGRLWGSQELSVLEKPWKGGHSSDLAARAILDADLGGAFYVKRQGVRMPVASKLGVDVTDELFRLRPDWVTVIAGSNYPPSGDVSGEPILWDDSAKLLGYLYQPGGPHVSVDPVFYTADEVAAWTPLPDPSFRFRGMSWLTPVIREIMGDQAANTHKLKYFENGATPNLVISPGANMAPEKFDKWVDKIEGRHTGVLNAYRTLYLGAGSTVTPVGNSLEQVDFKVVQGAGETRIAAAAGVPPVLAGLSEGLASATYSNYTQARHAFADMTVRPLWRGFCGSLEMVLDVPGGSRLWYDDRDVPFLREDGKDLALIEQTEAATIGSLIQAGYKPDSVVDAVINHDWNRLVHTGLYSVQLMPLHLQDLPLPENQQPPGPPGAAPAAPAPNGNKPPAKVPAGVGAQAASLPVIANPRRFNPNHDPHSGQFTEGPPSEVTSFESSIKGLSHERLGIFGGDGTQLATSDGGEDKVPVSVEAIKAARADGQAWVTHNHPGFTVATNTLSMDDVHLGIQTGAQEVRAVAEDGTVVSLARSDGKPFQVDDFDTFRRTTTASKWTKASNAVDKKLSLSQYGLKPQPHQVLRQLWGSVSSWTYTDGAT